MSGVPDPVKRAMELAEQRAQAITDDGPGGGPGAHDGNFDSGRIPVRRGRNPDFVRDDTGIDTFEAPNDPSLYERLPPELQAELAARQLKDKVDNTIERNKVALETEKFYLERRKRMSALIFKASVIFGIVAIIAFVALIFVLVVTGWKAQSLSDTSVLGAIITAIVELVKFLGGQ